MRESPGCLQGLRFIVKFVHTKYTENNTNFLKTHVAMPTALLEPACRLVAATLAGLFWLTRS